MSVLSEIGIFRESLSGTDSGPLFLQLQSNVAVAAMMNKSCFIFTEVIGYCSKYKIYD
jgi:hypothetical protein